MGGRVFGLGISYNYNIEILLHHVGRSPNNLFQIYLMKFACTMQVSARTTTNQMRNRGVETPNTHRPVYNFAHVSTIADGGQRQDTQRSDQSGHREERFERPPPHVAAAPLFRAGAFDLVVLPTGFSQPPPEQDERTGKRAEDAAA